MSHKRIEVEGKDRGVKGEKGESIRPKIEGLYPEEWTVLVYLRGQGPVKRVTRP